MANERGIFGRFARQTLSFERRRRLVERFARMMRIDLTDLYLSTRGVGQFGDEISGEPTLLTRILPRLIGDSSGPVLFDVGANIGHYALQLRAAFPAGRILAFEPSPAAFEQLKTNTAGENIECRALGLSDSAGTGQIYLAGENHAGEHSSLYADVLSGLHKYQKVEPVSFQLETIDALCERENISRIDFLKIDTEGHEFKVLSGAKKMLDAGAIRVLQFEFNEMNVISRVFLRDFFQLLAPGYALHRLHHRGLIAVPAYSPKDEIFQFQNYVALHRSIVDRLRPEDLVHGA